MSIHGNVGTSFWWSDVLPDHDTGGNFCFDFWYRVGNQVGNPRPYLLSIVDRWFRCFSRHGRSDRPDGLRWRDVRNVRFKSTHSEMHHRVSTFRQPSRGSLRSFADKYSSPPAFTSPTTAAKSSCARHRNTPATPSPSDCPHVVLSAVHAVDEAAKHSTHPSAHSFLSRWIPGHARNASASLPRQLLRVWIRRHRADRHGRDVGLLRPDE